MLTGRLGAISRLNQEVEVPLVTRAERALRLPRLADMDPPPALQSGSSTTAGRSAGRLSPRSRMPRWRCSGGLEPDGKPAGDAEEAAKATFIMMEMTKLLRIVYQD